MVDLERFSGFGPGDWEWQKKRPAAAWVTQPSSTHRTNVTPPIRANRSAKAICDPARPSTNAARTRCGPRTLRHLGWTLRNERASLLGVRSMRYPGRTARPRVTFVVTRVTRLGPT